MIQNMGVADKLGHFWATYAFSDALIGLYKNWGYSSDHANLYAALSSWTVQAFMEAGDDDTSPVGSNSSYTIFKKNVKLLRLEMARLM